ncbi:uncharacterized protein RJT20DRAFT_37506 [Scheffersomyces xylosifermentans]|uniref:uncharacterized protein n=1 Tax=Scheffersomyces xylosifermentans TaxID=1304137 RepID=UPI00315C6DF0
MSYGRFSSEGRLFEQIMYQFSKSVSTAETVFMSPEDSTYGSAILASTNTRDVQLDPWLRNAKLFRNVGWIINGRVVTLDKMDTDQPTSIDECLIQLYLGNHHVHMGLTKAYVDAIIEPHDAFRLSRLYDDKIKLPAALHEKILRDVSFASAYIGSAFISKRPIDSHLGSIQDVLSEDFEEIEICLNEEALAICRRYQDGSNPDKISYFGDVLANSKVKDPTDYVPEADVITKTILLGYDVATRASRYRNRYKTHTFTMVLTKILLIVNEPTYRVHSLKWIYKKGSESRLRGAKEFLYL